MVVCYSSSMISPATLKMLLLVVVVLSFIIIGNNTFVSNHLQNTQSPRGIPPQSPRVIPPQSQTIISPHVHVVPTSPSGNLPHNDCVPLPQSPRPGVKICIHSVLADTYVSGTIKSGQLWEQPYVQSMREVLMKNQDMQLLDLGANIGQYTLMAAAMGRHVLAVEMLPENILLIQTSLTQSNLGENVTLVHNAVYSEYRNMSVVYDAGNIGGTGLADPSKPNKNRGSKVTVNTILWDDLLPLVVRPKVYLKIDIEGSEAAALSRATRFFKLVNVPAIHMEWLNRPVDDRNKINAFMKQHGYVASKSVHKHIQENTHVASTASHDVFFIKI